MSDPITRLNAALEGRYAMESELGEGGHRLDPCRPASLRRILSTMSDAVTLLKVAEPYE